jgi:hypothetical protein
MLQVPSGTAGLPGALQLKVGSKQTGSIWVELAGRIVPQPAPVKPDSRSRRGRTQRVELRLCVGTFKSHAALAPHEDTHMVTPKPFAISTAAAKTPDVPNGACAVQ